MEKKELRKLTNKLAETREALTFVGDLHDLEQVELNIIDSVGDKLYAQKFIEFLSTEEATVLLLRHLGYDNLEIQKIMNLAEMKELYKLNRQIKMHSYLFKLLNKSRLKTI